MNRKTTSIPVHVSYEFSTDIPSVKAHRPDTNMQPSEVKITMTNCKRKHPETVLINESDLIQFCRLLTDPNCSVGQGDCSAANLLHACIVLLPLLSCPNLLSVPVPIPQPNLQPEGNWTGGSHLAAIPDYDGVATCWQHVQMSWLLPETEQPASTLNKLLFKDRIFVAQKCNGFTLLGEKFSGIYFYCSL